MPGACHWCGAAQTQGFFDKTPHWEWCRQLGNYLPGYLTTHVRSQPPRIDFNLGGRPSQVPRPMVCFLCCDGEGELTWPVTYTWGEGQAPGWVALCIDCALMSNEERQGMLGSGT